MKKNVSSAPSSTERIMEPILGSLFKCASENTYRPYNIDAEYLKYLLKEKLRVGSQLKGIKNSIKKCSKK